MKALFLFLLITTAFAQDPYQKKPYGYSAICDNSKIEIGNLPPLRDQGRFGLCYAHSSILLLEHLRCGKTPDPAACYANGGSVLHLSRYHNTVSENKIKIGGDPRSILTRFVADRKLAQESCAEYEDWKNLDKLYKEERKKLVVPREELPESDFFYYISRQIKQNKATPQDLTCWANDLMKAGVNQNMQEIMAVLAQAKDLNWQELRYQMLVPKSCFKDPVQYPDYSIFSYPSYKDQKSFKGFRDFVFRALSAGVPVEASFKSSTDGYHSSTIVGQRHVCDQQKCELQFRLQNSYGRQWQNEHEDGWVNAENLSNLMGDPTMGVSAILPKGNVLNTKITAPYYESSPISNKATYSAAEKCWRVPEGSQQYITESQSQVIPSKPVAPVNTGEKGLWKCVKDGVSSFGDYAIVGADCKKLN